MVVESLVQKYIIDNIIPLYSCLDNGHNDKHIMYVIRRSIDLAKIYEADLNMVYVIAAFHDLGMIYNREKHEIISSEIMSKDVVINQVFNAEKISIMCEAIKEHRASYKGKYHSIYGKIVSQADRNFDIEMIIYRSLQYGLRNFPKYSFEEHYCRTYEYIQNKYGENGYIRIILPFEEDEKKLDIVRKIIYSKQAFRDIFNECYKQAIVFNDE